MILGAHNAITYLKPKCLFLRPFKWIAKCQSLSIEELIHKGVKCFDLRVRFDNKGNPYLCHGLIRYCGSFYSILHTIAAQQVVYIRLGYEGTYKDKDFDTFKNLCRTCKENAPLVKFQFCCKYPEWQVIEDNFDKPLVEAQVVPSWKNFWLGPKYLSKYQDTKIQQYKDQDIIVLADFIYA